MHTLIPSLLTPENIYIITHLTLKPLLFPVPGLLRPVRGQCLGGQEGLR